LIEIPELRSTIQPHCDDARPFVPEKIADECKANFLAWD